MSSIELGKAKIVSGALKAIADFYGVETIQDLDLANQQYIAQLKQSGDVPSTYPDPSIQIKCLARRYGRNPTYKFEINLADSSPTQNIEIAAPSVWNATLKIRMSLVTNRALRDLISNNVSSIYVSIKGFEDTTRRQVSNSLIDYGKEKPSYLSSKFIANQFSSSYDLYNGRTPNKNNFEKTFDRTSVARQRN